MKTLRLFLISLLAITGWAQAEIPQKASLAKYTSLWQNSPFTTKPAVDSGYVAPNPLNDYSLLGISPISSGYRITLINRKQPEQRIFVESDRPSKEGFKIVSVNHKPGNPLGTTATMMSGSSTGTVSFDPKLLALVAPAASARQNPAMPPLPPNFSSLPAAQQQAIMQQRQQQMQQMMQQRQQAQQQAAGQRVMPAAGAATTPAPPAVAR